MTNTQVEAAANGWLRAAGQDILGRIRSYRQSNPQVGIDDLADVFNISRSNMDQLMHGNLFNFSSLDLIKLFVASGLALDIKPIDEALKEMHEASNRNSRHDNARQQQPQPRDRFGRFMPRNNHNEGRTFEIPIGGPDDENDDTQTNPYESMSNEDLCNIIRMNLWQNEIDLDNADHDELVDFLLSKEMEFARNNGNLNPRSNWNRRNDDNGRVTSTANCGAAPFNFFNTPSSDVADDSINYRNQSTSRDVNRRNDTNMHQNQRVADGNRNNVDDFINNISKLISENPDLAAQIGRFFKK